MSNLKINIRILMWYWQVDFDNKWSWKYNEYHKKLKHGWFDVIEFRPLYNTNKL